MGALLITGAAGGIGGASARALAGRDGTLILCDFDAEGLEKQRALLAPGVEVQTLAADLTDSSAIARILERTRTAGGLDALVHAAGVASARADPERILRVNLAASHRLVDGLLPLANEGAGAVLLASQAAHLIADSATGAIDALLDAPVGADWYERLVAAAGPLASEPGNAYSLSKRGVQRLVVDRAPAWGARGARIVSISPGVIDTGMGREEYAQHHDVMDDLLGVAPLGPRMGRPEEIASVAAFLCSPAASYVTGIDLLVDAGSTNQALRG